MCVRIARKRVLEAVGKGAGTPVTACPACKTNLGDGVRSMKAEGGKLRIEMMDIVELVAKAV